MKSPADSAMLLAQMADVEARIAALESRQSEQSGAMRQTGATLEQSDALLQHGADATREGEAWLAAQRAKQQAELDRLRSERSAARQESAAARLALRRSAVALAAAPANTDPAAKLGLFLLQRRNRERAMLAARDDARLAADSAQAGEDATLAENTRRDFTAFAALSLAPLRERHAKLVAELRALQSGTGEREDAIARLRNERVDLENLVAKLKVDAEKLRENEAAQGKHADATAGHASPQTPSASAAASADHAEQIPPAAATPTPTPASFAEPINIQLEGVRRLFWHAAPVGVRALEAGRVVYAGPFAGYRHLLILDHGGGWRTLYGNLVQCNVVVGQTLASGASLGEYRAAQGKRAEPLWLEVRHEAEAVEPSDWPAIGSEWERRLFYALQPGSKNRTAIILK